MTRIGHLYQIRTGLIGLVFLMLVACVNNPKIHTGTKNWQPLAAGTSFVLTGKMAFSDGDQGGSGQLEWVQKQDSLQVTLKAPLSKRSWQLTEQSDYSMIRQDDGQTSYADNTDELVDAQLGWDVPWQALRQWVRGEHTANGSRSTDEQGDVMINDQGWQIVYTRFKATPDGQSYPSRITARNGSHSIKLVIKSWQW
ncbi:lipoprotein insertase outer membrane protein LolB [Marinicella sediminis]|uniref:Outer-membrane lipoprotein LolB n=1 Tax=Marinicella sediminis TaxID=1792834 RepID=A0ABV7J8U9_9GAMM|nr:lipoprotein insertase outer membrane protein LolB [Marinicella sediminis]